MLKTSNPISVTIVTVHFADLKGLKKTVESVKAQNFKGTLDHLVIDGDTTEDVREYLRLQTENSSKPGRSFRYVSELDNGPYHAMNKGISLADGDVIWFLNAGDTFAEKYSLDLAMKSLSDPLNQWGYGATIEHDSNDEIVRLSFMANYDFKRHAFGSAYVPHPSSFVGMNIMKELGGFQENIRVSADQILLARAGMIIPPIIVPAVISNFEVGGLSSTISVFEIIRQMRVGLLAGGNHFQLSKIDRFKLWIDLIAVALTKRLSKSLMQASKID